MKKKSKIPKFKNEEEEAKFWDTHSVTDFLDEFKPVKPHTITFAKPLKHLFVVRLDRQQLHILKETLGQITRAEEKLPALTK